MKKLYTIALALLCAAAVQAQLDETFAFVDADGKVVANGTTLTVHNYEEDDFGDLKFVAPLGVKNMDMTAAGAFASMTLDIKALSNGALQHCFPGTCWSYTVLGLIERTDYAGVKKGETKALMSEWIPTSYGNCTVAYTIRLMAKGADGQYATKAQGHTVTVNFVYDASSTGVPVVKASAVNTQAYNLLGQPVSDSYKGVIIKNGKKTVNK